MIALYLLFWVVYLGTPLFVIGWWIWLRKPIWPMVTALGLWLMQFLVWAVMGVLLWLAWRRRRGLSG